MGEEFQEKCFVYSGNRESAVDVADQYIYTTRRAAIATTTTLATIFL